MQNLVTASPWFCFSEQHRHVVPVLDLGVERDGGVWVKFDSYGDDVAAETRCWGQGAFGEAADVNHGHSDQGG